jgi:serine/threonine-protein phosphatase 2B catalytic subunit
MSVPTDAQFFSRQDPTKPDVAFLKNHFYREGRVTEDQAMFILEKATALLREEPNVLQVDAPITGECACRLVSPGCHLTFLQPFPVCGDIHGQYVCSICLFIIQTHY